MGKRTTLSAMAMSHEEIYELIEQTSEEPEAAADSDATSLASTVVAEYSLEELGPATLNAEKVKHGNYVAIFLESGYVPKTMLYAIVNADAEGAEFKLAALDVILNANTAKGKAEVPPGLINLSAFDDYDIREKHELKRNPEFRGDNIGAVVERVAQLLELRKIDEEIAQRDKNIAYYNEQIACEKAQKLPLWTKKRKLEDPARGEEAASVAKEVQERWEKAKRRHLIDFDEEHGNNKFVPAKDAEFASAFDEEEEARQERWRKRDDVVWGEAIPNWVLKDESVWRTSDVKELCKPYNPEEAHTYQEY